MTVITYTDKDVQSNPRYKVEYVRLMFEQWLESQPLAPVIVRKGDGYRSAQVTSMWNVWKSGFRSGEAMAWMFDDAPENMLEDTP